MHKCMRDATTNYFCTVHNMHCGVSLTWSWFETTRVANGRSNWSWIVTGLSPDACRFIHQCKRSSFWCSFTISKRRSRIWQNVNSGKHRL